MTLLWRKFLECSSSLLTSSSLWSQSYGGRFWSVLPHCSLRHPCDLTLMEEGSGVFFLTAHFVIPVISLTSSSLCPHSLRHPCVLTPMTCLLTHLIVIPDFSLESSHPSHRHPWLLTLTSLVLPLIPYSVFSHTPTLIALTKSSHRHPWLLTPITCATMLTHPRVLSHLTSLSAHTHHLSSHTHHLTSSVTTRTLTSFSLVSPHWVISHHLCSERVSVPTSMVSYYHQVITLTVLRECLFPLTLPWCRTTTKSTLTLSSLSHTLPSMSSLWTLPWCRTTTKSSLTALRELVLPLTLPWCRTTTKSTHSLLWENLCSHSHFHGVVLPPSHHSHPHQSLCSHSHSHGVVLPPSHHTHCSERTCAPTHTPIVSYYHQVYPLTALRECLFPLTLPWYRTTTKSTHSLLWESVCSHSHSHGVVLPPSHHSHPHQSLCSHSLHFTSFSLQMHHQPSPTLSHPSCLHHIIITSSPLPITYHHQSLPLTPYNTPNPSISLPTLPIVS